MNYTWGDTNRYYAQAKASGDPSQLAFVAHLRSKITAQRNRRASHAHASIEHVPSEPDTGRSRADVRNGDGDSGSDTPARASHDTPASSADRCGDPAHGARRLIVAAEMLKHFGDVLPEETVAKLEVMRDELRDQYKRSVNDAIKSMIRKSDK